FCGQQKLKEKLEALDRLKSGMNQAKVSKELGVGESKLREWIKDEEKLRSVLAELDESEGLERKCLKTAQDNQLDRAVFTWFTQERSDSTPISGDIIRKQDASAHQGNEFKSGSGWFNHFKKHYEIIIDGDYAPEQIYKADETGLCYHMLPDRTFASRTEEQKAKGFKVIKERVRILFCMNKNSSHKLKPLCIGKSKSSRAFHHKNMDSLSFIYHHSKNAWMTLAIFEEWFNKYFVPDVRSHLCRQKLEPEALLLFDNCPTHSPVETLTSKDRKIKLNYLPKNTTSKIQPLNQGIITTFKMNYRKASVKKIVEDNSSIMDVIKKLNLLDVFNLGETAWLGITPSMIEKCWHCGLKSAFVTEKAMEAERVYRELMARTGIADVKEWMEVDAVCPTYERLTYVDIIHNVAPQRPGASENVSNPEDSDEEPSEPLLTAADVAVGLEIGLKWLESQDVDRLQILQLKSITDLAKKKARSNMKQQSITSFFLKIKTFLRGAS
uniref:HTH CENPB-type domain-containing protein n=1 Tax=Chelonoidis abingdonii TaxID=106734 RepID=A0A8C0QS57_CHEAB